MDRGYGSVQLQAMYGFLGKPQGSQVQADEVVQQIGGHAQLDDPRHRIEPGRPQPYLRYFFPRDFNVREGSDGGEYFQYFDVVVDELREDAGVPPPPWAPNAYFRLSFTQTGSKGTDVDVDARVPAPPSDSPLLEAQDLIARGGAPLMREGAEAHLEAVMNFCRSVASFRARTWKDAFPLTDLLRGVLLYLLTQIQAGQELAREYAHRDAMKMVEQERVKLKKEHAAALEAARASWDSELDVRMGSTKDALRKQLADELAGQVKQLAEERDRWQKAAGAAEATVKKLTDAMGALERQVASLEAGGEAERAAYARTLAARDKDARGGLERVAAMEGALVAARQAVLDALHARSKQETISAALSALSSLLPGGAAYVAELKTTVDADAEDAGLAFVREFAVGEGPDSVVAQGLAAISPGFLQSPLGPDGLVSGSATPMGGSRPTSALTRGQSERPVSASSTHSSLAGLSAEEVRKQLVWKYVQASPGQEFMVGKKLAWGEGVSWSMVGSGSGGQPQGSGAAGHEVWVEDVAARGGVHFFKPSSGASPQGSYLAVPLRGRQGEVVGLLGVDTLASGAGMSEDDAAFVRALAEVINGAVAKDQAALADLMAQATTVDEEEVMAALQEVDPEPYADLAGGLKMFKSALDLLRGLSDEDLAAFLDQERLDDVTLAVIRSVLGAAGEMDPREAGRADWGALRGHLTRSFIDRLASMAPQAAWAEWKALCGALRPLFEAESQVGKLDGVMSADGLRNIATPDRGEGGVSTSGAQTEVPVTAHSGVQTDDSSGLRETAVGGALGRWVNAVRKVSASNALKVLMEERLARANAALVRTFQGEGSSALQELRSYRVPPRITYNVLQAILLLCGAASEDEELNWGRMRVLTTYKMVRKLTEVKPGEVAHKLLKAAHRAIKGLEEDDVKKESVATLALYRWLVHFCKLGDLVQ